MSSYNRRGMEKIRPLRVEPQSLKFLRFDQHRRAIYEAAAIALQDIGAQNNSYTRRIIRKGPKTGRIYYWWGGRSRRHQASAPGQAPANMRGRLRRGVNFRVMGNDKMEFGDTVFYGLYLEQGTKKMKPRPHLSTAVRANLRYAEQRLGIEPLHHIGTF